MALPTLTTAFNNYPNGHQRLQNNDVYKGTVTIAAGGTYQTNGLPWTLSGNGYQTTNQPNWGELYSASTGYIYRYDPVHQTIRIFETGTSANTPLNELGNGASVTTDTVYFRVEVQIN